MKKALVLLLLTFILISFAAQTDKAESNATRAIILYNMAISQMSMGDYTDAFKNLKEARELLPTIGSVVDGFQKIYDSVKYHYIKQMILINKLGIATNTTVTKKTNDNEISKKPEKPLFIYGLLGFLTFFVATYSLLYFVEIKKSIISGFFVSTVIALASKYGYAPKVMDDDIEDEDSDEILEIEEVDQAETDQIEHKIAPEDVEDENVEEILSQLLGINEDEPTSEEKLEEELESEEELSQEESSDKQSEEVSEETESEQPKEGSESSKDLSDDEENQEKSYALKIEEIKDPRNDMILTIDRLKEELHQIISVLREKEISNQDELDNALKIMYVYATTSNSEMANKQPKEKGGNDDDK